MEFNFSYDARHQTCKQRTIYFTICKKNYKNQGNKNKANIFFEKYISEYLAKNVIRKLLTSLNKLLKSETVMNINTCCLSYFHFNMVILRAKNLILADIISIQLPESSLRNYFANHVSNIQLNCLIVISAKLLNLDKSRHYFVMPTVRN